MSICVNMITGKFKEPFLKEAIISVLPILDEVVFVDTAPGNNPNIEDMESFSGAKIVPYHEPMSYAKARNLAKDSATTEWIIPLDADEVIHEKYLEEIKRHSRNRDIGALETRCWHHMYHPDYIIDRERDIKYSLIRRSVLTWERDIHEGAYVNGVRIPTWHIRKNHYGWCRDPKSLYDRHKHYDSLMDTDLVNKNYTDDWLVNYAQFYYGFEFPTPYTEPHPTCIIDKLKEMFPDLGTFSMFGGINEER